MSDVLLTDERGGVPSASKFERIAACPGSRRLEESLPNEVRLGQEEYKDETADTGVIIHKARETGRTLDLDQEQLDLYQSGLKYEQKLLEKWAWTYGLKPEDYEEGPREQRIWLHDPNTLQPILSGKLDVHFLTKSRRMALCPDWKTGFSPNLVPSKGNWQLRVQAILLKQEHPELEIVRVAFVKPRFDSLDFTDYSEADLNYSMESIRFTLWWSTQPDAPRVPGPQCRYCPGKAYCPEAAAYALLPSIIAKGIVVETTTAEDLARVFEMSPIVGKIIEAVKRRLKTMPADELAKLGLMLPEHGRKADYCSDVAQAFKLLTGHFLVEDVLKTMQFLKGPLVELVMRDRSVDKAKAEAWLDQSLDACMTRGFNEPSLQKLKG